jgi:hypothetical protein
MLLLWSGTLATNVLVHAHERVGYAAISKLQYFWIKCADSVALI